MRVRVQSFGVRLARWPMWWASAGKAEAVGEALGACVRQDGSTDLSVLDDFVETCTCPIAETARLSRDSTVSECVRCLVSSRAHHVFVCEGDVPIPGEKNY